MNYSRLTDQLLIGTTPGTVDYGRLREMGVRLVINMRFLVSVGPPKSVSDVEYLHLRTFDSPLLPIPVSALMRGTREALRVSAEGGSVYIHCSRGRHRSVAMAAAILIAQGQSPEAAMALIKKQRPEADPGAPYIRSQILKFANSWKRGEAAT